MCVVPFPSLLYAWWHTADEANYFFVQEMEWLEVGCVGFGGSPDGDMGDDVWVSESIIELDERFAW